MLLVLLKGISDYNACWELATDSLLKSPIECGPTKISADTSTVRMQPFQIRERLESLLGGDVNPDTVVSQPDWVKSGGILIKPGAYFVICTAGLLSYVWQSNKINILLMLDNIILQISHMKVEYFDSHYHASVADLGRFQRFRPNPPFEVHLVLTEVLMIG